MIEWKIVRDLPRGRRAPCDYCRKMVPAEEPRQKLWNPAMSSTGGKNGPGLWMHKACATEFLEAVRTAARQEEADALDIEDL